MKILIIGSKGFIGSHCVAFFLKEHQVWQCDVVVDYVTPNYFLLDATNNNFDEIFRAHQFDVCINCSGAASVPDSIKNPQRDFVLNTSNVFLQLDGLRRHIKDCKYINISSAAVYGNPEALPVKENQQLSPISPYGKHKKMAEEICEEFFEQYGTKTCSIRVFSAYGPGLKKQLFWDLYQKYKRGEAIELFGTGRESRDFIYISDLVQAINCVVLHASFNGDCINVANGKEITIARVAEIFYGLIDEKIKPVFAGHQRKGDPINWVAAIDVLSGLGYNQTVAIEDGLSKYIAWAGENE